MPLEDFPKYPMVSEEQALCQNKTVQIHLKEDKGFLQEKDAETKSHFPSQITHFSAASCACGYFRQATCTVIFSLEYWARTSAFFRPMRMSRLQ